MTAPEDIYYWHPVPQETPGAVRRGDGMHYQSRCAAERPSTILPPIPGEAEIRDLSLRAILARTRATTGSADWKANAALLVQRAVERQQDQSAHESRHRRMVSRVPAEYWPIFEAPEGRPAFIAAKRFMASDKLILILSGTNGGEGKSCAAAWCVDQGGVSAEFIQAGEMAQHGSYEPLFWRGLFERSVLALNELGNERVDKSGWFAGAFCDLIDVRIASKRRTVITTNLGGTDFMQRYATGDFARLKRRWEEYGKGFFIQLQPWAGREPGEEG